MIKTETCSIWDLER